MRRDEADSQPDIYISNIQISFQRIGEIPVFTRVAYPNEERQQSVQIITISM
jgi:hypothetical protein